MDFIRNINLSWCKRHMILCGNLAILSFAVTSAISIDLVYRLGAGFSMSISESLDIYESYLSIGLLLMIFYSFYGGLCYVICNTLSAVGRPAFGKEEPGYRWAMTGGHAMLVIAVFVFFLLINLHVWDYAYGLCERFPWRCTDPRYEQDKFADLSGLGWGGLALVVVQFPALLIGTAVGAVCGWARARWPGRTGFVVLSAIWLLLTTGSAIAIFRLWPQN